MPEIYLSEPKHLLSSRDIIHAHPYLQERWPRLVRLFQDETGRDLLITCSWRSPREQMRLYQIGRTVPGPIVTHKDGQTPTTRSLHNVYPSRAIDVAVDIDPNLEKVVVSWNEEFYRPLVNICHKLNLISGGSWQKFRDWPHIQMPTEIA